VSYIKISMVGLLLLVVFAVIPAQQAYACSCIPPAPPLESMANSDAVFSGKVMRIDSDEAPIINSADPVKVVFNVSRVWKGPEEGAIALSTARESASCGYNFVVGEEYLVYATNSETGLTTGLCNRTMPLSSAGEDLAALGEGVVPAPATQPTSSTMSWGLAAGALLAGLVLIAAVILLKPRKG
jgi:hypothetical protein